MYLASLFSFHLKKKCERWVWTLSMASSMVHLIDIPCPLCFGGPGAGATETPREDFWPLEHSVQWGNQTSSQAMSGDNPACWRAGTALSIPPPTPERDPAGLTLTFKAIMREPTSFSLA